MFKAFCRKIDVANIREYEERQLKVAQEESKARLQFEAQIARLGHQYVFTANEWVYFGLVYVSLGLRSKKMV